MRKAFCECLFDLMAKDERVMLVDADLAKASGTVSVRDVYPNRAFDVGVAEANMISVAAGLASYGNIPFCTSFTPFASRRVCDQITLSVCYAKQNVKIVGTDPGISAELNGGTHMSLEDIGVLRSIPNIVIFEPVDETQLRQAMPIIKDYEGPVYMRLFRKIQPDIFNNSDYKFDLFKADKIIDGTDVTILSSGIMVAESIEASKILAQEGIKAEVINVHTIKPIDVETVVNSAKKTGCVVTAENHNVIGGLYSAVCETLSQNYPVRVYPIAVPNVFGEVGKMPYLKEKFHLRAVDICEQCRKAIMEKK